MNIKYELVYTAISLPHRVKVIVFSTNHCSTTYEFQVYYWNETKAKWIYNCSYGFSSGYSKGYEYTVSHILNRDSPLISHKVRVVKGIKFNAG